MKTYHVSRNGVPCVIDRRVYNIRGGVLRPVEIGEAMTNFGEGFKKGGRKAIRAMNRTMRIAEKLCASVIHDWEKIRFLTERADWKVGAR